MSGGPDEDIGEGEPQHADVVARIMDWISRAGTHAMGRVTYEEMSGFWPTSTDDFAGPMNAIPKVVFSRSLTHADWETTTIARGDLAEEVAQLKDEPGGEVIVHGGYRDLVQSAVWTLPPAVVGSSDRCRLLVDCA